MRLAGIVSSQRLVERGEDPERVTQAGDVEDPAHLSGGLSDTHNRVYVAGITAATGGKDSHHAGVDESHATEVEDDVGGTTSDEVAQPWDRLDVQLPVRFDHPPTTGSVSAGD